MNEIQNKEEINKEKAGFEIDGVLAYHCFDKCIYERKRMDEYYSIALPTKFTQKKIDVIITRREKNYFPITSKWLLKHNIKVPQIVYYQQGKNNLSIGDFKVQFIKNFELGYYYESNSRIAKYLYRNCPNTKIIFVKYAQPLPEKTKSENKPIIEDLSTI